MLPADFAPKSHQPPRLQQQQQRQQQQPTQLPTQRLQPSQQPTQSNPEMSEPAPQQPATPPPPQIRWQQQQRQQRHSFLAPGFPPPRSAAITHTTPAAGIVIPPRIAAGNAVAVEQQKQQQQQQQHFAPSVVTAMKKQAAATRAKAEAEARQMRAAAVAMWAEAQADVHAAAVIRKKAEALLEVAEAAGAAGQTSIFSRPADADGELFLPFGLDAEEDEVEHEAEDLKHGNYLKFLSPSDTARSLETLPTGASSTMTEADAEPEDEPEMPRRAAADSEFAYATVIFGDDPRFPLEAAVMGASLKARTKMDMVCLHTEEVPEVWREVLVSVGWKLQEVQHTDYSSQVYKKEGRFAGVFTKLQVVGLDQYSKVVMLDSDMLIRCADIDEIFTRDAPAAVRRHSSGRYVDFQQVRDETFFMKGKQVGGINAGFVLLNTSKKDLKKMELQLSNALVPGRLPFTHGPEQDYLTRYYAGEEWQTLGIQWNFQLHQIAYCTRKNHTECARMKMGFDEIKVVHFSGERSPAEWCFEGYINQMSTFEDFVSGILLEKMLTVLRKDISVGKGSKRHQSVVAERLKDVTFRAAEEWKEQLDELLKTNAKLCETIKTLSKKEQGPELARRRSRPGRLGSSHETSAQWAPTRRSGTKRPRPSADVQGEFPAGSWWCKDCRNVNYPYREVCNWNTCKSRRKSQQPWAAAGRTWKRMAQADKQRRQRRGAG